MSGVPAVSDPPVPADYNPNGRNDLQTIADIANPAAGPAMVVNRAGDSYPNISKIISDAQAAAEAIVAPATTDAKTARDQAVAAAQAAGLIKFYASKTEANTALSGLTVGQQVRVFSDDSQNYDEAHYNVTTGPALTLVYVFRRDRILWVDPATGNDGNDGSRAAPFATITASLVKAVKGTSIKLAPAAIIKENLSLGSLTGIDILGDPGAPAIFNAFDSIPASSWTAASGLSNTYQASVTHSWSAGANRGYPALLDGSDRLTMIDWGFGTISGVVTSAAAKSYVDANPGTCTVIGPGTYAGGYTTGIYTYYAHPTDGSNPSSNGRTYRFAQRAAPMLNKGNRLHNVKILGGVAHDGVIALNCFLRNVHVFYPGAHAWELAGCETENTSVYGSNYWVGSGYAYHHFNSVDSSVWDLACHANARAVNWTGPFNSIIGCHAGSGGNVGNLLTFDGLVCENVTSVLGVAAIGKTHLRGLIARNVGTLGAAGSTCYLEKPLLHFNGAGAALMPASVAGVTIIIDGGQVIVESGSLVQNTAAGAGALVIENKSVLVQKNPTVNSKWANFTASCDGVTIQDSILAAPLSIGPSTPLGTSVSGSAAPTIVQMYRNIYSGITPVSTWMPDASNINADPLFHEFGEDGARINDMNSPYRFRLRRSIALAAAPASAENAIMALTSDGIWDLNMSLATAQVYNLSVDLTCIKHLRDSSANQYFVAVGAGGALHRTTAAHTNGWAPITTGLTKNWTCIAASTTTPYHAILGADDGSLTYYDPNAGTDTFTTVTSPTSNALYGAHYNNGAWIVVGNNVILRSTDGNTFNSIGSISAILRAVTGTGNNWVAVGDDSALYFSADNGATWTAAKLQWTINFTGIAVSTISGQFLAVGQPLLGKIAAYTANQSALASGVTAWTQVSTPLDNIKCVAHSSHENLGTGHSTAQMFLISGPAWRMHYSEDLVAWTADNPPPPAYLMPLRTSLESDLLNGLLAVA